MAEVALLAGGRGGSRRCRAAPGRARPTPRACGRPRPPRAGPSTRALAAGRSVRLEEGRAEQVLAPLEGIRDGDQDPLAVEQQVGQVVGDEVAHGDRQQPGADRARADQPRTASAAATTRPRNTSSRRVLGPSAGAPNTEANATVCDRPSKMIDPVPRATSTIRGVSQVRDDEPRRERPAEDGPPVDGIRIRSAGVPAGRHADRRQPVEGAEPDRERLAARAPGVAAELGHQREREDRVPGEDDGQGWTPGTATSSSQTKNGNPATAGQRRSPSGSGDGAQPWTPMRPQHPGAHVVEGRERVEPLPDREDQRRDERDARPSRRSTGTAARRRRRTTRRRCPGP